MPATSTSILERLSRWCARHPWRVLAGWVLLFVAAIVLNAFLLGGALTNEGSFSNEPESARADRLIQDRMEGAGKPRELVIVRSSERTVDDPAFSAEVDRLAARITALGPAVVEAAVPYSQVPNPSLISRDRHAVVLPVVMAGSLEDAQANVDALSQAVHDPAAGGEFETVMTGTPSINEDFGVTAENDLRTGEAFGLAVALIILLLVFGTAVAAALPLVLAVVGIVLALGLTALAGQFYELSMTVTNMISMIGLAVGIDYALFIVSRFREERAAGLPVLDAVSRSGGSATRAVLFSGVCVIVALAGLLLIPSTVFRSMAVGAILVVLSTLFAAVTLLPALLGLLGDRVDAGRIPFIGRRRASGKTGRLWAALAHGVMRRPVVSLVLSTALLLAIAGFTLDLRIGASGVESLPAGTESRAGYELLATEFSSGLLSPVTVVVDGAADDPAVQAALERFQAAISADTGYQGAAAPQVNGAGDLMVVDLLTADEPTSDAAEAAVQRLRDEIIPGAFAGSGARALVTGVTAGTIDYLDVIDHYTPWVFAFVLSLSFLFLTVVFRSLVVPAKAILMNLLSVGAAYGLIVAVFQKGWGADLLGFQQVPYVEAWIPLFLFAVLFGTSMDYHVFLLSRIRERYDERGDNGESVAFGLQSTAGIITGAAVIMVAVFGGFAAGDLVMFQQLGFGLAAAVLIDATIVRCILVPAAMRLLGDTNWWLPQPLHWLPDVRVETRRPAPQLQPVPVERGSRR